MHNRFFSSRNGDNNTTASPRSPLRRLRLFSMNERPRKSKPVAPALVQESNDTIETIRPVSGSPTKKTQLVEASVSQKTISPKKASGSSPKKSANAAPPLTRRQLPPVPLLDRTPPPPLEHASSSSSRSSASLSFSPLAASASKPGVSFQRNDEPRDPIAAKMSTYDNNNRSAASRPTSIQDPIAAKIAAHDNHNNNNNNNSQPAPVRAPSFHDQETTYMEIAPGKHVRLRGAKETWQCVENDFYLPTTCFSCDIDLCCIMDASYVLCPLCKVVSPVEGWAGGPDGGVGLGFTYLDLAQWQQEIMQRRQQAGF